MVMEILNTMTSKGKKSMVASIIWFAIYALAGVAMMLLVLKMLNMIVAGKTTAFSKYWWYFGRLPSEQDLRLSPHPAQATQSLYALAYQPVQHIGSLECNLSWQFGCINTFFPELSIWTFHPLS
jgi:hypothetical protein